MKTVTSDVNVEFAKRLTATVDELNALMREATMDRGLVVHLRRDDYCEMGMSHDIPLLHLSLWEEIR